MRKEKRPGDEPGERDFNPATRIFPADLSEWRYRPRHDRVAVDPVLGRIVFPSAHIPKDGVWVSYYYGFSANIGGGEYDRPISQTEIPKLYHVGPKEKFNAINRALRKLRHKSA